MDSLRTSLKKNLICKTLNAKRLILFFTIVYQLPAHAQPVEGVNNIPIEEVQVVGKRSLLSLRFESYRAEDRKYELFNSLNSTDEFDITCEGVAALGTRIKTRVCDVNYMKKAREDEAEDFFRRGIFPSNNNALAVKYSWKTKALNKEMIELALENPELADAMFKAEEVRLAFLKAREETFKNNILIGHPETED